MTPQTIYRSLTTASFAHGLGALLLACTLDYVYPRTRKIIPE
jgi:hypothetical protein